MNTVAYLPQSKRLLEQVSEVLRYKHYSLKTEQAYLYWVRFFVRWHGSDKPMQHPRSLGVGVHAQSGAQCSAVFVPDRGREGHRPPLPPNRACGFPGNIASTVVVAVFLQNKESDIGAVIKLMGVWANAPDVNA